MKSNAEAFFLPLLFVCKINFTFEQSGRYNSCDSFLRSEKVHREEDSWENRYVSRLSCLVCPKLACDFSNRTCDKESIMEEIPLYENILEFGLVGENLPLRAVVNVYIRRRCTMKVLISTEFGREFAQIQVYECVNVLCVPISYRYYLEMSDRDKCIQVGIVFMDINKIYYSFTTTCLEVAVPGYDSTKFLRFRHQECVVNNSTKLTATWNFWQDDGRRLDGVLLALPCTAGGYLFDQNTGRLVVGQSCRYHLHYLNQTEPTIGMDFIFKRRFKSNIHIVYPHERRGVIALKPIYLFGNGTAASRESMQPSIWPNPSYINKVAIGCDIVDDFEHHYTGERISCEEMLSTLPTGSANDQILDQSRMNYFIPSSVGCFVCPKLTDGIIKNFSIPMYHKLLEFGFSGQHFPENATAVVSLTTNCEIKIQLVHEFNTAAVHLYECKTHDNDCLSMPVSDNARAIIYDNAFCVHVGFAFHNPSRIFYAFTFRCWEFASSRFTESGSLRITHRNCGNPNPNPWISFTITPSGNDTIEGVPLILPCSSGGYVVNARTGRYLEGRTCDPNFWKNLAGRTTSGNDFILKNIFNSNQNLLFARRDKTTPYPRPLYIRANGKPLSEKDTRPRVLGAAELSAQNKQNCPIARQGDIPSTTESTGVAVTTATGDEEQSTTEGRSNSDLNFYRFEIYFLMFLTLNVIFHII